MMKKIKIIIWGVFWVSEFIIFGKRFIVNQINDTFIDLRDAVNEKTIPENENTDIAINLVEKRLDLKKQQKSQELRILTPK